MIDRIDLEMNMVWAEKNPVVFTTAVKDFMVKFGNWKITIDATRKDFVTFIAKKVF